MRISTKGRYSLEALLYLAVERDKDVYITTKQIAAVTGITEGYLEQLFIPLRGAGLIEGVRGPTGGYKLSRPNKDIRAGDVLRAVEGNLKPTPCVDPRFCKWEKTCQNRHTWKELYDGMNDLIDSVTLESLAKSYHTDGEPEYTI